MHKHSNNPQIERLNQIATEVAKGDERRLGVLSSGERIYAVLAANRTDLLGAMGDTVAEALARLGPEWTAELVACWQYAGDPRR